MKPILLFFNLLVITLAEMLASRALQKSLPAQRLNIDTLGVRRRSESRQSSSDLPWRSSTKITSRLLLPRTSDRHSMRDRQSKKLDSLVRIVRRDVPNTLSRRSPMQAARPISVKETAARINQGERDAEAQRRAQEAAIAEARERARTMSPSRGSAPSSPAGPLTPEQPTKPTSPSQRQALPPPRAVSPVQQRLPSPPRGPSSAQTAQSSIQQPSSSIQRPASPGQQRPASPGQQQLPLPPPRSPSPPRPVSSASQASPPTEETQSLTPQSSSSTRRPTSPVNRPGSAPPQQSSSSRPRPLSPPRSASSLPQPGVSSRVASPERNTLSSSQQSQQRLATSQFPPLSQGPLSVDQTTLSLQQRLSRLLIPQLPVPSRETSPERPMPSMPKSSASRPSSPTIPTTARGSSSPRQQVLPSEPGSTVPQVSSSRSPSPMRQRPPATRPSSPIQQQQQQQQQQQPSLSRQSSLARGSPPRRQVPPVTRPSSPQSSTSGASHVQILSAQPTNIQSGEPSPFQAPNRQTQPGTPARLSRTASGASVDSFKTAGSSVKDASDPAVLDEALRRTHSLPSVQHPQDSQHLRSVQSASQPASPRQRSPLRITQAQRSVSHSDNLEVFHLSSSTPTTPRASSAFAPRPLRSALRGSTGNLVGMVPSLQPLREDTVETPGAGLPATTLLPLAALEREDPVQNPTTNRNAVPLARAPSLRTISTPLQRAPSLPRDGGVLPQVGRTGTQSSSTGRSQPGTPNHANAGSTTQSAPIPRGAGNQSLRRNTVAGASSSTMASLANQNQGSSGDRSVRNGRVATMRTQLSARMGEAAIENDRHPGKFGTTIWGSMLSGGIVGGIGTCINHHSVQSIVGGTLAGTCVGLTGIVGTCYFMKNARTTVERENISFEDRLRRGHETLSDMRLVNMVPNSARNAWRKWRGQPPLEESRSASSGSIPNGNASGSQTPAPGTSGSLPTPFAAHPDRNHPENLVRRGLLVRRRDMTS